MVAFTKTLYPKAHTDRISGRSPTISPTRRAFLRAALINFALLQLLFLGLFAYIFGALFKQNSRVHHMNVLFVDYDGGAVGQAVRQAYRGLEGDGFPSLIEGRRDELDIGQVKEKACSAQEWAVLFVREGASGRLEKALGGGDQARGYNRSDVLGFVWNEASYSSVIDSTIASNLQTLSSAAELIYQTNGTINSLSQTDPTAVAVFAKPWTLTSINIQPTPPRLTGNCTYSLILIVSRGYNTLVFILILIQEFFYLGTINGLYAAFKIYSTLYPHRIIIYRTTISLAYTMIGSLCTAGMVWAFRAGWHVNGAQFVLSWLVLWLFAHANFLAFDCFTVWLPAQYVPMALITWIVFNVTSILLPFELSSGFYRWAYVMPAHEAFQVLIDIWSGGCNPKLHYALPILFVLEALGLVLSGLGVHRRCHFAVLAKEQEEKAFQDKIAAAVAFERKKHDESGRRKDERSPDEVEADQQAEDDIEEGEREELASVIREEESQIRRTQTRASRNVNFGPSFDLPFHEGEE